MVGLSNEGASKSIDNSDMILIYTEKYRSIDCSLPIVGIYEVNTKHLLPPEVQTKLIERSRNVREGK